MSRTCFNDNYEVNGLEWIVAFECGERGHACHGAREKDQTRVTERSQIGRLWQSVEDFYADVTCVTLPRATTTTPIHFYLRQMRACEIPHVDRGYSGGERRVGRERQGRLGCGSQVGGSMGSRVETSSEAHEQMT